MLTNRQLSFNSNIRFVSRDKFEDLRRYCMSQNTDMYEVSPVKKSNYTTGAGPCHIIGINNTKKCFISHPGAFIDLVLVEQADKLNKNIEKLRKNKQISFFNKQKKNVLNGLLNAGVNDSIGLNDILRLKGWFKEKKIPCSIIWGQNVGSSDALYKGGNEDTWYLSKDEHEIKTVDELKKAFAYIDISRNDQLWLDGKKIDAKEVYQNPFE